MKKSVFTSEAFCAAYQTKASDDVNFPSFAETMRDAPPPEMPPCPQARLDALVKRAQTVWDVKLTRKEKTDLKRENRLALLVETLDKRYLAHNESAWFWKTYKVLRSTRSAEQAFFLTALALEHSYGYSPDTPLFVDMLKKRGILVKPCR